MQIYVIHYSEIGLKGGNRPLFERILIFNIKRAIYNRLKDADFYIYKRSKRIFLNFRRPVSGADVENILRRMFGVAKFAPVNVVEPDLGQITNKALELMRQKEFETFAVRARRSEKAFPINSEEVNRRVGEKIFHTCKRAVDLKKPQVTCFIDIFRDRALVYCDKIDGPAGLPVGSAGKVLVLLSGGFDSPVAAWYAMKRGARCEFIHFHSEPFTSRQSRAKIIELVQQLNQFQFRARLFLVPFARTQQEIVLNVPEEYRVILFRRFMMRVATRVAVRRRMAALYTGESLGQVASQTLFNMAAIDAAASLPVMRPLIGMDKNEIMDRARLIETAQISARPHDDVCTRFMPRHPVLRARLHEVTAVERNLDIEAIIDRDYKAMEIIDI